MKRRRFKWMVAGTLGGIFLAFFIPAGAFTGGYLHNDEERFWYETRPIIFGAIGLVVGLLLSTLDDPKAD